MILNVHSSILLQADTQALKLRAWEQLASEEGVWHFTCSIIFSFLLIYVQYELFVVFLFIVELPIVFVISGCDMGVRF